MILARAAIELLAPEAGIRISSARCLRSRFGGSRCEACANHCSRGAISIRGVPVLDPARCTSCRRCEAACPVGAIESDQRDFAGLIVELGKVSEPVLGCRVAGVRANVHTGCLGFLNVEAVLALAAGVRKPVTLNLSRCAGCRNGSVAADIEAAVTQARVLLDGIGSVRIAKTPRDVVVTDAVLSRRQFFVALGKRGAKAAASTAAAALPSKPPADGRERQLPAHRRALLTSLSVLPAQHLGLLEAAVFPAVEFGSACNACTGCAGMCPTGAIAVTRVDPPRPLFVRQLCTGCGVCNDFCPAGGVRLTPAQSPQRHLPESSIAAAMDQESSAVANL